MIMTFVQMCGSWCAYRSQYKYAKAGDRPGDDQPPPRRPWGWYLLCPLALVAWFILLSPALMAQWVGLAVLAAVVNTLGGRPRVFGITSLLLTLALTGYIGSRGVAEAQQVLRENPFESLADRLAYEDKVAETKPTLTSETEKAMAAREEKLGRQMNRVFSRFTRRRAALELVHTTQVRQFIGSEGFGIGRNIWRPSLGALYIAEIPVPRQPGRAGSLDSSSTGTQPSTWLSFGGPRNSMEKLTGLHDQSQSDFLDPRGFGLIRDPDHVAGFRSHRFWDTPTHPETAWQLQRVELVSLLKHENPGVYVSKNLPRMDEFEKVPLRPLDGFERPALGELHDGEDLVVRTRGSDLRMFGSLRASKTCLQCHSVPRGTLLGAFSYQFQRRSAKTDRPAEDRPPT